MLKRFCGSLCVLSLAALMGLGCDDSSGAKTGTGGTIGGGTGGATTGTGGASSGTGGAASATGGAGGASMGTGGATGTGGASTGTGGATATGGTSGGTGGAGGAAQTPLQIHTAIINAPAATGVTSLDPSIAGTPKTYNNGVCQ